MCLKKGLTYFELIEKRLVPAQALVNCASVARAGGSAQVNRESKFSGPAGPCLALASPCYSDAMLSGYVPIFIFLAIAIAFPVITIVAAKLIRPSAPFAVKLEAYECGIKAA